MFFNDTLKLLNEAPGDTTTGTTNTTTTTTTNTQQTGNTDSPTTTTQTTETNTTEQNQQQDDFGTDNMGNDNSFDLNNNSDEMGGTDDSIGDMGGGDTSGTTGEEEVTLSATEKEKKLILLNQYKNLISVLNNLKSSVDDQLLSRSDFNNNLYIDYLSKNINTMKDRINFILIEKFLTDSYENLLKMFFYFKYQLVDMVELYKNLVNTED